MRLVVVLLVLPPLCTKKLKKHVRRENENTGSTEKVKQRKAGKVQQVIDGGGFQVGTSERPGRCQPSPLRKKDLSMSYMYLVSCIRDVYVIEVGITLKTPTI